MDATRARPRVGGVVLAAGQGRRMGGPKALVLGDDGVSWLHRTLGALTAGGAADDLVVAVGAARDAVVADAHAYDAPVGVRTVDVPGWREGMGVSLRTVLTSYEAAPSPPDALLLMLVDLPDVGAQVVRRLRDVVDAVPDPTAALARATYEGRPGHPVLVGRDHWAPMASTLSGDEGGRGYLAAHAVRGVECGDLASGRDRDTPLPPSP